MTENAEPALFARASAHGDRTAVVGPDRTCTYREVLERSARVAAGLLAGADDLREQRAAFLVPPGADYVATQWGIWRAGGIALPLGAAYPLPELEYAIADSQAAVIVAHPELAARVRPLVQARGLRLALTSELLQSAERPLPVLAGGRRALILYTSGTTSRPKGVVTTHAQMEAQVRSLVTAWEWSAADRILNVLPLHHIHGIINVLTCAVWSGAQWETLAKFDADTVWERLARGDLTLFMAVPTIYAKLLAAWRAAPPERQRALSEGCRRLRLMVSGSAALPVPLLKEWQAVSGHVLLERYGMTEIGMALANPLRGERRPGYVGTPLPNVEVQLLDDDGREAAPGTPGEIHVRGPGVFREYWGRPEATAQAFRDEWFRTGDVAVFENGSYRILGRRSVDILKTGGYKVSALEIEAALLEHPAIRECAVVGLADPEWGQRVAAAVVLAPGRELTLAELRGWALERLAKHKVPTRLVAVEQLPRNALGKVAKPQVADLFPK